MLDGCATTIALHPCPIIGLKRQQRAFVLIVQGGNSESGYGRSDGCKAPEGSVGNYFEPLKLRGGLATVHQASP